MQRLRLLTLTYFITLAVTAAASDNQLNRLYNTLDSLLEQKSVITAEKEARIKVIREELNDNSLTEEQLFKTNERLYDEYMAFRFDSAFEYIHRNLESDYVRRNEALYAETATRLAHILSVSGIFNNARHLLFAINPAKLSIEQRIAYYDQQSELNLYRSEMATDTPYFQDYIDSLQHYRQLILEIAPKDSYAYIFNTATYICEQGEVDKAIDMLQEYLKKLSPGHRQYSIITSTLAYFYWRKGQPEEQERYLLLSAISDIKGAILENNSMRELATILMERGEHQRAYKYLFSASFDARQYGSRLRSLQVARLAPLITQAYDAERTASERRTDLLLFIVSVIALLLVGTMVFILSLLKKHHLDNEKIQKMNAALEQQNAEIQKVNSQMKESNHIKDEYIGRFLELSSNLIYRGEERAKQLNRLARDRKLEELYAELKSQKPINEGIHQFHTNFDTAFLNIYPNFVTEVNLLMTPGNAFEIQEGAERLTTELRVLALIRLGITGNQKIADILRSSITTIYTYRSKLKARAVSRDTFEDDVRRIATYDK